MIRKRKAAVRIQAWIRRALVRLHWGEVLEKVAERNKCKVKLAKLQSKLEVAKQELETFVASMESANGANKNNARQVWEASVLQGNSEEAVPENERSPLEQQIIKLQAEFRSLQVQTKTMDGTTKPLQKNLASAQETYQGHRTKYQEIQEQIQALDANKKELIRRRREAEKRAEEYQKEGKSLTNSSSMMAAAGPMDQNFHRAFQRIMEILRLRCDDKDLIDDVQEEIDAFSKEDYQYEYTEVPMNFSPQKRRSIGGMPSPGLSGSNRTQGSGSSGSGGRSRRRTLQGSLAGLGSPSLARSSSPHGRPDR